MPIVLFVFVGIVISVFLAAFLAGLFYLVFLFGLHYESPSTVRNNVIKYGIFYLIASIIAGALAWVAVNYSVSQLITIVIVGYGVGYVEFFRTIGRDLGPQHN